jgi:hypothetical protein
VEGDREPEREDSGLACRQSLGEQDAYDLGRTELCSSDRSSGRVKLAGQALLGTEGLILSPDWIRGFAPSSDRPTWEAGIRPAHGGRFDVGWQAGASPLMVRLDGAAGQVRTFSPRFTVLALLTLKR